MFERWGPERTDRGGLQGNVFVQCKNGIKMTNCYIYLQFWSLSLSLCRILKAGKAVLYTEKSSPQTITHVLTKDVSETSRKLTAPYFNISYIAEHLFGVNYTLHISYCNTIALHIEFLNLIGQIWQRSVALTVIIQITGLYRCANFSSRHSTMLNVTVNG